MHFEPLLLVFYFCSKDIAAPCSATQSASMQYYGANDFIRKIPGLVDDDIKKPLGIAVFAGRTAQRQQLNFRSAKTGIANSFDMVYNYNTNTANVNLGWSFDTK